MLSDDVPGLLWMPGDISTMTLVETYKAAAPSVVAFISKFARTQAGLAPIAPTIFGTGFLVHEDGIVAANRHVAEVFETLPKHPLTGEAGYGALLADYERTPDEERSGESFFRMMVVEVFGHSPFSGISQAGWYGEPNPDIAFVQLKIKETPFLKLANHEFYIQPGTSIATAGFPLGTAPLTLMGKWHQLIPFVRGGIVSSVYPCAIPWPHGFTIDIMQQGGSSGSPIFYSGDPTVVGMMASSVLDPIGVASPQLSFQIGLNTNISIAIPAHIIDQAAIFS
jgi:hypothetical protein